MLTIELTADEAKFLVLKVDNIPLIGVAEKVAAANIQVKIGMAAEAAAAIEATEPQAETAVPEGPPAAQE